MKQIRESKFSKIVAYYLIMMMVLQISAPIQMYALTSGPTQPEFNSFTPIGTSDMVDLASGDFNYNIPIMDVGGYPINMSYNPGITMDQEASWVGLGWNMNVGQIERQMRGLPDDFRGDEMVYENNLKKNRTVGMTLGVNGALTGVDALKLGVGLGVESNNYQGISFKPSFGIGFQFNDNVSVGMDFTSSLDGGATVSPRIGISLNSKDNESGTTSSLTSSLSLGFNSRKGIENLNVSASVSQKGTTKTQSSTNPDVYNIESAKGSGLGTGGSVSFNNLSFTPAKRIGFRNENFSFNAALGGELFGVEGQVQVTGYGSYQVIADEYRNKIENAYGYENTEYKKDSPGILDFNRENDKTVTENTLSLPVTNYTYDIYNIEGQGVSGMFRPYRSKVSYVYNDAVVDIGNSQKFGAEAGLGNLVHASGDFKMAPSISSTGGWFDNNNVLPYFTENNTDRKTPLYEPTTLKMVGGMIVDPESIYKDKIFGTEALRLEIAGNKKNTYTSAYSLGGGKFYGNAEIKRAKRFIRSQLVQKITANEGKADKFIIKNDNAKPHHTAGIKVLKTDGSTYVYGEAIYNIKKVEATFDVSGRNDGNNTSGLVGYNASVYGNGNSTSDEYVNRVTTPAYAHSYLLSSVLSSDYEDIDNNGPSINDLGSYTKFEYTIPTSYNWRVPFQGSKATYNEGLISKKDDQKGNYLYGVKELKYLDKIVTKSHVAFFDIEARKDAIGVLDEVGGKGPGRMQKLKAVRLYSRPEVTNSNGEIFDPNDVSGSTILPIKTAHFVYSYDLCRNMPNNEKANDINNNPLSDNEISNRGGKLTLERVYFTYKGSNMGKYTPYVFNYGADANGDYPAQKNPNYDAKGFDIWGNYKENPANSGYINTPLSNTEFAFVEQNKTKADVNTQAWNLKSIKLPSGGTITIDTESDDYQYVQNKKAMQMYKVVGVGHNAVPTTDDINARNILYNGDSHKRFLYVKLDENDRTIDGPKKIDAQAFKDNYLRENLDKAIQFRFMLNMTDNASYYEYVQGYLKIGNANEIVIKYNSALGGTFASIPVQMLTRDKGHGSVNPIAKAGWGFGRTFMNRLVYGSTDNPAETDFKTIVKNLEDSIKMFSEIFQGPNGHLQTKGCARIFKPEKSWIRLENSDGYKLGGGLRVKSITLSDNWNNMLGNSSGGTNTADMKYGQSYTYDDGIGKSSGVATFEPNMCAENPFVEPFYNKEGHYAESIVAPMESNYVEKPFGVNFFPAPRVTYSRVSVKNIDAKDQQGNIIVKKHATGSVVTEHYTSRNFPTKVSYTDLRMINGITPDDQIGNMIASIIVGGNLDVRNLLTLSQGYAVETNDMNGKVWLQKVYNEAGDAISSVEYKYNVDDKGDIDSNMTTIDEKGQVEKRLIGVDYDLINDFNRSFAQTTTSGFKANIAGFLIPVGIFPIPIFIPTVFPESSVNVNELRTAVTTKHVHKTAILVEKIATDFDSTISTKNLAWDANSGEVLLTETQNEYGDNYYSFNYPAYWMYDEMGAASRNIGVEGRLIPIQTSFDDSTAGTGTAASNPYFKLNGYTGDLTKIFQVGDEIYAPKGIVQPSDVFMVNSPAEYKAWIVGFNEDKTAVLLMSKDGIYFNRCLGIDGIDFKIMRSGNRNIQTASMASITSMINPIDINKDGDYNNITSDSFVFDVNSSSNPRIVNASAVEYNDFWLPQADEGLPYYPGIATDYVHPNGLPKYPNDIKVNPYVWNIKGDWKAEKSHAYLTGRKSGDGSINNSRNEGFFTSFSPFYQLLTDGKWTKDNTNWTDASSITKVSPYGAELENKDALNRYSSAQYGYQYKLPTAVASNSKYEQMAFENFEEKNKNYLKSRIGFYTGLLDLSSISSKYSHTGKNSLKVKKDLTVSFIRSLKPNNKVISPTKCPTIEYVCFMCNFELGGCPICPERTTLLGNEPNSLFPPAICIDLLGWHGPVTYTGITYCLEYPNNGSSATFAGGHVNITPTTNTQKMYLTINVYRANVYQYMGPPLNTKVYVEIVFTPDGKWTYTCVPFSNKFTYCL